MGKGSGQRLIVEKKNNIYQFTAEIADATGEHERNGEEAILLPLSADQSAQAACASEPTLDSHVGLGGGFW